MTMRAMLILAAVAATGCYTGPTVTEYEPAVTAAGATVTLNLRRRALRGEMLELNDSSVVIRSKGRIHAVSIPAIRSGTVGGTRIIFVGSRLDATARTRLRHLSRYPGGIPPQVMQRLLAESGQDVPEIAQ